MQCTIKAINVINRIPSACEMLLVLISVAEYSSCFLFYFKHSSIYVPLQFKLKKEEKWKASGGGKEKLGQQPPKLCP